MEFLPTAIPDVVLIRPKVFGDARGFFMETFHARRFAEAGITGDFVQDNHSGSHRGTLRGLHYQIRQAQGKLLRCLAGEIFDVAVDIRRGSPTFGKWVGVTLTAENRHMVWVPPGFAHGFYVLSEWGELAYKTTDYYAPEWERSLSWNDPAIGIDWPLIPGAEPILSDRDKAAPPLAEAEIFPADGD
ncbi:MAG TPA: dTDP-4-dehydrorhamnose 3,5-epimerase [Anaerolineales bacterium]|nr:dTDP-4-dehydrorhamnose 3,5-epimerase [Anaerolineales bacterium]